MNLKYKKQVTGLLITLLIVLAVFISFISYNQWPILTGKKIILATQPVDPFDPFRGQYMSIRYEISSIDNVIGFKAGDSVYVIVKEDGQGIWRFKSATKTKPGNGDFIKGEVTSAYGNFIRVNYGVEQFFFERGAKVPTSNITVEVAVANSGRAKLVQLLQNGKPVDIEYPEIDITS